MRQAQQLAIPPQRPKSRQGVIMEREMSSMTNSTTMKWAQKQETAESARALMVVFQNLQPPARWMQQAWVCVTTAKILTAFALRRRIETGRSRLIKALYLLLIGYQNGPGGSRRQVEVFCLAALPELLGYEIGINYPAPFSRGEQVNWQSRMCHECRIEPTLAN